MKIKSTAIKALLVLFVFSLNGCATLAGIALLGISYGILGAMGNNYSSTPTSTSSANTSAKNVSTASAQQTMSVSTQTFKSGGSFGQRVKSTAALSRKVNDIDNDGRINCCDRALYFYWYWTRCYDEPCELVVNQKNGYMNHMFVRLQHNDEWYCIEPQSNTPLDMKGYWSWKYDPAYNKYQGIHLSHWLSDDYVLSVMQMLDKYAKR